MIIYLETGCGACLRLARSVKHAESQTLKEVGTTAGVQVARKATPEDIAWVEGMGGRNPAVLLRTK